MQWHHNDQKDIRVIKDLITRDSEVIDKHRTDDNIVIDVIMKVNGETFHKIYVLEDYRGRGRKQNCIDVIDGVNQIGRNMGYVFSGADRLYGQEEGYTGD